MSTAKLNGVEIAYSIHGEGEPFILIGGFTATKEAWRYQIAGLSPRFRVISFDNRGVGESTVPTAPFTIADMAADTVGLMDSLGIEAAHVFGISMGGLIAQVLALDYPQRVRKVALGCTTHGGRHAIQPEAEVMALLGKAADSSIPAEKAIRMRIPILFAERFIREETGKLEEFVQLSLRYSPTPQGAAGQMRALSRFNVRDRLPEIRHRVLVITGSEDRMMPPENSKLLAQGIQGAELYEVEGAGHLFFQEKPDEVNGVLIDFFGR